MLEKGDFFGEMAMLERHAPLGHAPRCIEDGDLIVISGDIFGDMIKANPEIAVRMLRKQSIRLRETNKQLEQALRGQRDRGARREPTAPSRRRRRARGHAAGGGPGLLHLRLDGQHVPGVHATTPCSAASTP